MPKGVSETHDLATWFWNEILDRGEVVLGERMDFFSAPRRHTGRYMKEAKIAIKEDNLDIAILKLCLTRMVSEGVQPKSLLLPTQWRKGDELYYDVVLRESQTPPPVYEPHAFKMWCVEHGREDLLESLNE